MDQEAQLSIGLSLGAAVAVLSLRLVSLLQAGSTLEMGERATREALDSRDGRRLRSALRRLSAGVPFGDWTTELLVAAVEKDDERRARLLEEAKRSALRRIGVRTGRGQALDLVALALTVGLSVFASSTFRLGSTFLLLGCGSLVTLLVATLGVRARLKSRTQAVFGRVAELLRQHSVLDEPLIGGCPFCGATAGLRSLSLTIGGVNQELTALGCSNCGRLSADFDPALLPPPDGAPPSSQVASE